MTTNIDHLVSKYRRKKGDKKFVLYFFLSVVLRDVLLSESSIPPCLSKGNATQTTQNPTTTAQ